ncbi:MAG TPA: CPBP family intramembrane glutamic endopeptidase [Polyangiaceae bacterium]
MRPLAAALAAMVVVGATAYFAFLPRWSGTWVFWALAAGPTIVLSALALLWARQEGLAGEWLRWKPGDFTLGFVAAAALFGVAWAVVRLVAPVGSEREIWLVSLYAQIGDPRDLQAHVALVAPAICAAAFAEEVVWRGAVTRLLAQRVGSRSAWVWAAVLYALAYVPTAWSLRASGGAGGLDPVLPLAALGAGLLWGGIARAAGRIAPAMVAHALFDWAVIMMFPLWGAHG